jgi:hypothetical protein
MAIEEIENCRFRTDEVAALQCAHEQMTVYLRGGGKFTFGVSVKTYKSLMDQLLPLSQDGCDGRENDPADSSGRTEQAE